MTQLAAGKSVFVGVPTMDNGSDLWDEKIAPLIKAHPEWRQWLPKSGVGAKGGKVDGLVLFENGAKLRFMTSKGGDENRSGYTGDFLVATEVDRYMETGKAEGSPLDQMISRVSGYGKKCKVVLECTVTTKQSRIWREVMTEGTGSKLWYACPKCQRWQPFEDENLTYEGENELDVEDSARLICKYCDHAINEASRQVMIQKPKMVHRGQTIDERGLLIGEEPKTRTFGMRCNIFTSPIFPLGMVATERWKALRAKDQGDISQYKTYMQHRMALPWEDEEETQRELSVSFLRKREAEHEGEVFRVPDWAQFLVMTVDIQKDRLYWHVDAWGESEISQVVDKGIIPFDSPRDEDVHAALNKVDAMASDGWLMQGEVGDKIFVPRVRLVDCGHNSKALSPWLKQHRSTWKGARGYGVNEKAPTGEKAIFEILDTLQVRRQTDGNLWVFIHTVNVKATITDRYFAEPGQVGYTVVPIGAEADHYYYHLTSEERYFDEKKNMFLWRKRAGRKRNDFFDCRVYSYAAAKLAWRDLEREEGARQTAIERESNPHKRVTGLSEFIHRRGRAW